jgi:DNA-directed RNA polymerase specialized sigma24 family protein
MDPQEEIVRLLAIQVRMQFETQAEAIRELGRAGFGPTRIAELLGTTPGTVNVTLIKARGARPKKGRKASKKIAGGGTE